MQANLFSTIILICLSINVQAQNSVTDCNHTWENIKLSKGVLLPNESNTTYQSPNPRWDWGIGIFRFP